MNSYVRIQVWWDRDAEQKAYAQKIGSAGFPTIVWLDADGKPIYRAVGYREPKKFLAECVKAGDLLRVYVPPEARQAAGGIKPVGQVIPDYGLPQ